MNKKSFVSIFATYGNLEIVKQTLPSVIEETITTSNAGLIIHDSTQKEDGQDEKWAYLKELEKEFPIFLILSSNMSMAHARNMCLSLAQELYCPDYISMMEDDFGYKPGLIEALIKAMKMYYGTLAPNGFKYGLFTGSSFDDRVTEELVEGTNHSYRPVFEDSDPKRIGGTNSSFRCAPTSHWNNVLKGYDTDEYLISEFQTKHLNYRNYNKGFTVMNVESNTLMFKIEGEGRGNSINSDLRLYDAHHTASDSRSEFIGKSQHHQYRKRGIVKKSLVKLKNTISAKIKK